MLDRFEKFLESIIISDKVDSSNGDGNYEIHEKVYYLILNKGVDEYLRIKLAEYYCNIRYSYSKSIDTDKIEFVNARTSPTEEYKTKINTVIKELLEIFIDSRSTNVLRVLININSILENNSDIFKNNPIYDFFGDNYDKIDIFSKNELYKSVCSWNHSQFRNSEFYKKINQDRKQKLYGMLCNYFIEEIPGTKYEEREEYRTNYLKDYINNFKQNNVKEIIAVIDAVEKEESSNVNTYKAGKFLIDVGTLKKYGKEILKNRWNEYIFLRSY